MSEKKNIDRLFQEKFKDFEVAPPEQLWQNIEAELQKDKKERRVIPLWFRLSGIAAALVIGLMVAIPFFKGIDSGNTPVVLDNTGRQEPEQEPVKNLSPVDKPIKPNQTVTDMGDEAVVTNETGTVIASDEGIGGSPITGKAGATASGKGTGKSGTSVSGNNNTAVAYEKQAGNTTRKGNRPNRVQGYTPAASGAETAVAHHNDNNNAGRNTQRSNTSNRKGIAEDNNANNLINNNSNRQQEAIAGNNRENNNRQNQTNATQNNGSNNAGNITALPQENTTVANTNANEENTAGTVIDKAAAETAIAEAAVDTVKPQNELEKLLQDKLNGEKDKDEKAVADAEKNKWNIKPQLAPVFYNSMSEGSPIDPQFAGNSKDYENDLSYGVAVNYALNNRISIRTGVNTVNLNYTTNDIQFYAAMNQQTPNVAARGSIANIVVQNEGNNPGSSFADQLPTKTFNGSLVQRTGYIEVPLEMSYKLIDSRFGVDIIGGVSTLFLNENSVSVRSSQGLVSDMGKAQNLNDIHFSTNIGVGFKYRFWKAFEANFEPMFKYQVNTFSSNAGNFKPYFIGLYSGISFSF